MGILGAVVFTFCFKSLSQLTSVMIQEIPFYYPTCQALSYFASNTYLPSVQILTYLPFKCLLIFRSNAYLLSVQTLTYLPFKCLLIFRSNAYLLSVQTLTYFSFKNVYFNRKYKYITYLEYQVLLYLNTLTIVLR